MPGTPWLQNATSNGTTLKIAADLTPDHILATWTGLGDCIVSKQAQSLDLLKYVLKIIQGLNFEKLLTLAWTLCAYSISYGTLNTFASMKWEFRSINFILAGHMWQVLQPELIYEPLLGIRSSLSAFCLNCSTICLHGGDYVLVKW